MDHCHRNKNHSTCTKSFSTKNTRCGALAAQMTLFLRRAHLTLAQDQIICTSASTPESSPPRIFLRYALQIFNLFALVPCRSPSCPLVSASVRRLVFAPSSVSVSVFVSFVLRSPFFVFLCTPGILSQRPRSAQGPEPIGIARLAPQVRKTRCRPQA